MRGELRGCLAAQRVFLLHLPFLSVTLARQNRQNLPFHRIVSLCPSSLPKQIPLPELTVEKAESKESSHPCFDLGEDPVNNINGTLSVGTSRVMWMKEREAVSAVMSDTQTLIL